MDGQWTSKFFRPAHATIDLEALAQNYREIQRLVGVDVGVMAMVKADAYGHGAVPVSRKLVACGVTTLGVATVEEGLELRQVGIETPIVVMGGLMGMGTAACGVMVGARLTPVIHSANVLEQLELVAASQNTKVGVHLKIDTGMSRLGMRMEALPHVLATLTRCPHLAACGVMTHFAKAADDAVTAAQLEEFSRAKQLIENALGRVPLWHTANSMAILKGNFRVADAARCWVRPGILLYGGMDPALMASKGKFRPVMRLESKVALIKHVPAGTRVSYECLFTTARPSRIGVIPIGYADGYPLALSNKGHVLVAGRRVPVVGRVTMDMIMIDLTDVAAAVVGDPVVMVGRQGNEEITAAELAAAAGTISYEILTGVSVRMPRVYKDT